MDIRFRKPCAAYVLRIAVGCMFVLSAVAKYVSIDSFDLYVFEHHLFSYNAGCTLTRLLIAVECVTGICLIADIRAKGSYLVAAGMLLGFTAYLLLQPLLFELSEDDCHCFGKLIRFNRWESIGKNILLLGLLAPAWPKAYKPAGWNRWALPILAFLSVTAFLCINPPDHIYRQLYGDKGKVDTELYAEALENTGRQEEFTQGRQLVCFFSTACGHCRNAAEKLSLMARFHGWDESQLRCIFWRTDKAEEEVGTFYRENHVIPLTYTTFTVDTFLNVIDGRMPTILFSDNGKIVRSVNYIQMDENEMDAFLNGKQ